MDLSLSICNFDLLGLNAYRNTTPLIVVKTLPYARAVDVGRIESCVAYNLTLYLRRNSPPFDLSINFDGTQVRPAALLPRL